jgi:hypothetical protein
MPIHFVAWKQALAAVQLTLSEERFYALGGVPAPTILRMLADEAGRDDIDCDAVSEAKEQLFLALCGDVQPIAPVVAVARAHAGKLPMAVATGSPLWLGECWMQCSFAFACATFTRVRMCNVLSFSWLIVPTLTEPFLLVPLFT